MRIDADPADDRLDPDTGCPIPPVPSAEYLEYEAALAAEYEAADELAELQRAQPEQLPLF
jgi:hypothetical protein